MSGVQSIERAFALLRALSVGPAGITELAERADLPKSTVARIVSALETEGVVEQEAAGGVYQLGQGLADLAGVAPMGRNLIATARPHLLELTERTSETSGISVIEGRSVRYLDHVESEEEVLVKSWTGESLPLHLVPSGLVLLAGQANDFVDAYLSRPLDKATNRTVTDPEMIRDRLQGIREQGFLWIEAEYDPSMSSVAAPVTDGEDQVTAAIHVHGPAYRFPDDGEADTIGQLLVESATRLSAQMN